MTLGRIIRFSALFIILLSVWAYMNHIGHSMSQARSDLLARTRFLIRQAQAGDAETLARLVARYRLPAHAVPPLPVDFNKLWPILRDGQPNTVAYADAASPQSAVAIRQVQFQGKDEKGQPAKVQLEWVQVEGVWYINGYQMPPRP
jgi:hypothetical protein